MARSEITGKRRMRACNVSHSNIHTHRWQKVNVQRRRLWVPELKRHVRVKLTARALKTLDRNGAYRTLKDAGLV